METKSETIVDKIEENEEEVFCITLSPDSTVFSVSYGSSNIRHYKINYSAAIKPEIEATFKINCVGPVSCMSWNLTSTLFSIGGFDGTATVWNFKERHCTHVLENVNGDLRILLFSENISERLYLYGAANEKVYIWLLKDKGSELLDTLSGHNSTITGLQLGHAGDDLISYGMDKAIILWSVKTFTSKRIITLSESLYEIVLKPRNFTFYNFDEDSNNIIFTIGNMGLPSIWDLDNGKELWRSSKPISTCNKTPFLLFQVSLLKSCNSFVLLTSYNVILFLHCHNMNVWRQVEINENELVKIERQYEEKPTLMISIQDKQNFDAVRTAISLRNPAMGFNIIRTILEDHKDSFPLAIKGLQNNELATLLDYVAEWYTITSMKREASEVLQYLLKSKTNYQLKAIPNFDCILIRSRPYMDKRTIEASNLYLNLQSAGGYKPSQEEEPLNNPTPSSDKESIHDDAFFIECEYETIMTDNENEYIDHDDDYNDVKDEVGPVKSADDIRVNYTYHKMMADSDDLDTAPLESVEDLGVECAYETIVTDSETEYIGHDDDHNDVKEADETGPVESADDIRVNYTYHKMMADSDDLDTAHLESVEDLGVECAYETIVTDRETEYIGHDDDHNDVKEADETGPVESADDIRVNYTYHKMMADSDDLDTAPLESVEDLGVECAYETIVTDSETEYIGHDDDHNDVKEADETGPVESADDIRVNFTYRKIITDSEKK